MNPQSSWASGHLQPVRDGCLALVPPLPRRASAAGETGPGGSQKNGQAGQHSTVLTLTKASFHLQLTQRPPETGSFSGPRPQPPSDDSCPPPTETHQSEPAWQKWPCAPGTRSVSGPGQPVLSYPPSIRHPPNCHKWERGNFRDVVWELPLNQSHRPSPNKASSSSASRPTTPLGASPQTGFPHAETLQQHWAKLCQL